MATSEPAYLPIRKELGKRYSCYVLITCEEPTKAGDMKAELTFEGDEILAAYLIEHARELFDSVEEQKIR